MKRSNHLSLLAIVGLLAGCPNPADEAPAAKVGEVKKKPAEPAKPAAAAPKKLTIDASKSKVEFVGSKVSGSHDCGFKTFSGTIDFDPKIEGSKVDVEIDMASTYCDSEQLAGHLKSDDFFGVEKHPKAKFKITNVAKIDDGHSLIGTLELKGMPREIQFPAKIAVTDTSVRAAAEFSINRKLFGIEYPGKPDDLIRDKVLIKLDIIAPR